MERGPELFIRVRILCFLNLRAPCKRNNKNLGQILIYNMKTALLGSIIRLCQTIAASKRHWDHPFRSASSNSSFSRALSSPSFSFSCCSHFSELFIILFCVNIQSPLAVYINGLLLRDQNDSWNASFISGLFDRFPSWNLVSWTSRLSGRNERLEGSPELIRFAGISWTG